TRPVDVSINKQRPISTCLMCACSQIGKLESVNQAEAPSKSEFNHVAVVRIERPGAEMLQRICDCFIANIMCKEILHAVRPPSSQQTAVKEFLSQAGAECSDLIVHRFARYRDENIIRGGLP